MVPFTTYICSLIILVICNFSSNCGHTEYLVVLNTAIEPPYSHTHYDYIMKKML